VTIAYLASRDTLPGDPSRRADAFEYDQMIDALRPAAEAAGTDVEGVAWDAPRDFGAYEAAIIGTTWDYWERTEAFLRSLDRIQTACPLFNPSPLVRWNSDKRYLQELEGRGVPSIPTAWADQLDDAIVASTFARFDTDRLVAKRQVGAGAYGQLVLKRGEPCPEVDLPMLLQPFVPGVVEEGELSFVFVDGALSHALLKRPASGDYRVQSLYGGTEVAIEPTEPDLGAALAVVETVAGLGHGVPLYARVDLVRGAEGRLLLMEVELVEPFLYPLQGPELGSRLIEATLERIRVAPG